MRIAFAGTPAFAATALRALADANAEISLVLTQPDRPAGRGLKDAPSAVKELAVRLNLPLQQPPTLKDDATVAMLRASGAEVLVVAAYGLILPQNVLDAFPRGCINIHASILPRWRGAAPIHRAILAGDRETGISIMRMERGLDTGPVYLARTMPILDDDTTASLHDKLADLGGRCIVEALPQIIQGHLQARVQPEEGVTYAQKITKAEASIDWTRDAAEVDRQIRAFNPAPGAYTQLGRDTVKIWRGHVEAGENALPGKVIRCDADAIVVGCGRGAIGVVELQKAGGKRMAARDFLRGASLDGARFGAA